MKIAYWIVTILFSALLAYAAVTYFINFEEVSSEFIKLGFPTWVIYPLAVFELIGVAVILIRKNRSLVEWVYAWFVLNNILAFFAHISIADGEQWAALVALILVFASYFLGKKVRPMR